MASSARVAQRGVAGPLATADAARLYYFPLAMERTRKPQRRVRTAEPSSARRRARTRTHARTRSARAPPPRGGTDAWARDSASQRAQWRRGPPPRRKSDPRRPSRGDAEPTARTHGGTHARHPWPRPRRPRAGARSGVRRAAARARRRAVTVGAEGRRQRGRRRCADPGRGCGEGAGASDLPEAGASQGARDSERRRRRHEQLGRRRDRVRTRRAAPPSWPAPAQTPPGPSRSRRGTAARDPAASWPPGAPPAGPWGFSVFFGREDPEREPRGPGGDAPPPRPSFPLEGPRTEA